MGTDHQFLNPNLAPQPLIRHQATNATAAIVVHGNRRALGKIVYICLYDLAAVAPFGREAANCAEVMRAERAQPNHCWRGATPRI